MNRVKAGDAWARVSTKRYGFRLDGNEARIEILSISPSLFLSTSLCLSSSPSSLFPSFSSVRTHRLSLSPPSLDLSLHFSAVL